MTAAPGRLGLQRLRALLDALEAMDEAAFAAFLRGGANGRGTSSPALPKPAGPPRRAPVADVAGIGARLHATETRDAAQALLQPLTKTVLEALARALDVATARTTKPELIARIVAATVGARLDRRAMHDR